LLDEKACQFSLSVVVKWNTITIVVAGGFLVQAEHMIVKWNTITIVVSRPYLGIEKNVQMPQKGRLSCS
jgi:hypothetical protein